MLFRSSLEHVLPVKQDERKLSTNAAKVVFRGSYLWPNIFMGLSVNRIYGDNTNLYAVGVIRGTGKVRPGIAETWVRGQEHTSSRFMNYPNHLVDETRDHTSKKKNF